VTQLDDRRDVQDAAVVHHHHCRRRRDHLRPGRAR
jgi:hypothetical protein